MNLYLISQHKNNGYDTYDSAVVCAASESDAKKISPSEYDEDADDNGKFSEYQDSWVSYTAYVKCELIGLAHYSVKHGVVCASYNAG